MEFIESTERQSIFDSLVECIRKAQKQGLKPDEALRQASEINEKNMKTKSSDINSLQAKARASLKVAQPGITKGRTISHKAVIATPDTNLSDSVYEDRKERLYET